MENIEKLSWQKMVAPYAHADLRRSIIQIINTVLPFLLLWAAMYWSLRVSYWLILLLATPTAAMMVRTFILFHDCCHGSFFASRRANDTLGFILGVLTFTPYQHWKHNHAVHHATAGNLDKRGVGDVKTMTVEEYLKAPWHVRLGYRIMRHPLFTFTIGATAVFLVLHRFWGPGTGRRERNSVIYTNLALLGLFLVGGYFLGFKEIVLVQLPMLVLACSFGVWMFYVQHQFEGVYWERKERWNFVRAGLQGSSYYQLPALLEWISGNIGYHHIHHLSPKIPNYFLPQCYRANPDFQVKPLTLKSSVNCLRLALWDEAERKLVSFGELKKYRMAAPSV